MFNNEAEYASSRLHNSFVMTTDYDLGIFRVNSIRNHSDNNRLSESTIYGRDKNQVEREIRPDQVLFSLGRLGYVDYPLGEALYVTRSPIRRDYKQGIRTNSLSLVRNGSPEPFADGLWSRTAFTNGLTDCLTGRYRPFYDVLEQLEERGGVVPVSRSFALNQDMKVHYKSTPVGKLDRSERVRFDSNYNFLEQQFISEVGNGFLARL